MKKEYEQLCFHLSEKEEDISDLYLFLVNHCSFNFVLELYRALGDRIKEMCGDK